MSPDEIICIFNGREKIYYICRQTATEHLDCKKSVVRTEGKIPDGNITEFSACSKCEKTTLDGKLDGQLKKYDSETGILLLVENYSCGILHGPRIKFYENGKQASVENYKEGRKNGKAKEYYPNGTLRFEDTYDNGALVFRKEHSPQCSETYNDEPKTDLPLSKTYPKSCDASEYFEKRDFTNTNDKFTTRKTTDDCRIYHKGGEIIAKEVFAPDGSVIDSIGLVPDGIVKEFYDNGQLKLEETYKNGKPNGVRKKYDEVGRLWAEETYVNGKLNGIVRVYNYFKDKVFEEEAYFENDKLNGTRKTYYPNGRISVEENYSNARFEGPRKSYYENGQTATEEFYKNGKLDGMRIHYYDNGSLWSEERYIAGLLEGVKKDYYTSGQLRFEEFYKNGKLEGKRIFYFETGNVMYEELYSGGKLQERNEYRNIIK